MTAKRRANPETQKPATPEELARQAEEAVNADTLPTEQYAKQAIMMM